MEFLTEIEQAQTIYGIPAVIVEHGRSTIEIWSKRLIVQEEWSTIAGAVRSMTRARFIRAKEADVAFATTLSVQVPQTPDMPKGLQFLVTYISDGMSGGEVSPAEWNACVAHLTGGVTLSNRMVGRIRINRDSGIRPEDVGLGEGWMSPFVKKFVLPHLLLVRPVYLDHNTYGTEQTVTVVNFALSRTTSLFVPWAGVFQAVRSHYRLAGFDSLTQTILPPPGSDFHTAVFPGEVLRLPLAV